MEFNFEAGLVLKVCVGGTKLGVCILPFFFEFNTFKDWSIGVDVSYNGSISAKKYSLQVHTRFFFKIQMDIIITLKNVIILIFE
jgi:hypothetical protein